MLISRQTTNNVHQGVRNWAMEMERFDLGVWKCTAHSKTIRIDKSPKLCAQRQDFKDRGLGEGL